jgi:hypothetical protein
MATTKARGSAAMAAGKNSVQIAALQKAIKGFKLVDWHELGKPHPELIRGGISGSPGKIGAAVTALLRIKEIRGIDILINGQPKPDLAIVRFQMQGK